MSAPEPGATHATVRTFEEDDVEAFATVLADGDRTGPAADTVLLYGLLTGSLLSDLGGGFEVGPRRVECHFLRPVAAGETVRCACRVERVAECPGGWDVTVRVTIERLTGGDDGAPGSDEAGEESVGEATVDGFVPE